MTDPVRLSRRFMLAAGALMPAATLVRPTPAAAAAPMLGAATPIHYRFRLGALEVTVLRAGTGVMENPQQTYGMNVSPEVFAAASAAAFIPSDRSQNFFTPVLVNTGAELILFDGGLNAAGTLAALTAAGYSPDQVDVVVITHMHGDHINGLMDGEALVYPNARYVTGAIEDNHWAAAGNQGYDRIIRPLGDRLARIDAGAAVASGITAMAAFGHTPGHMVYHLENNGQRLVLTADLANHPVWSVQNPDWEVRFDADKPAAAQARRQVLGMLAADRVPFIAYHHAFPAAGFVEVSGDGFRHVPVTYQLILNG